MKTVLCLIILLLPSTAFTQCIKIITIEKDGSRCTGSGITIGRVKGGRHAVLTAAHVVKDASAIALEWKDGTVSSELVAFQYSPGLDVAIISAKLEGSKAYPIINYVPADNTIITFAGYPKDGKLRACYARSYGPFFISPNQVEFGDSGGPVLYNNYHVVGVVTGYAVGYPNYGWQTPSQSFSEWAASHLEK